MSGYGHSARGHVVAMALLATLADADKRAVIASAATVTIRAPRMLDAPVVAFVPRVIDHDSEPWRRKGKRKGCRR